MISIRSFLCRLHNFYLHFHTISMEVIILQGQLSQKERMLLEDLKKEEDLCVKKYSSYAQQAQCPQLSQLFNEIANVEKQHYNTVNQIIQSGGQSAGQQQQSSQGSQSGQKQGSQTWQAGQSSAANKPIKRLRACRPVSLLLHQAAGRIRQSQELLPATQTSICLRICSQQKNMLLLLIIPGFSNLLSLQSDRHFSTFSRKNSITENSYSSI